VNASGARSRFSWDRVHIMVDISDDTNVVSRRGEVTRVVRRRWSDEQKGRIVAEAITPGAVIAEQHLSNWIRAAKNGRFALPADEMPTFVPVVSVESAPAKKAAHERRATFIEIVMGAIKVRVSGGIDTRDIEAVLRAVRRLNA